MIEQRIKIETALLAKKLGFRWRVDFAYWTSSDPDEIQLDYPLNYSDYRNEYIEYHSAPTQSLLQKWLREEKKVLVLVNPIDTRHSWKYTILMEDTMSPFFEPDYDKFNEYLTYEDALESGLNQALKFLE